MILRFFDEEKTGRSALPVFILGSFAELSALLRYHRSNPRQKAHRLLPSLVNLSGCHRLPFGLRRKELVPKSFWIGLMIRTSLIECSLH